MSSSATDNNPYISMSDSGEEENKPAPQTTTKDNKDKDKESKKKKKKPQEEEYGPVGKTVVNLRKSLGHVTKTVIGKDPPPEEKQEINLAELEVIEIEDSDEETKSLTVNNDKLKIKRSEMPYFDYMPDEVIFNIFNRLHEKDMGRFAMTCKRMYDYMEDEDIWKKKAANWINLRVSRGNKATDNMKNFYVAKYIENAKQEEERRIATILQAKKHRKEQRVKNMINILNETLFNYRLYELPICLLVILWTIFMALRADEYILWSYHVVFIPLYISYAYVFFSCFVAFPPAFQASEIGIYPTYGKNLLGFLAEETKLWGFMLVGIPWAITFAFFLTYAFAKDSNGLFSESFAFIAPAIFAIPSFFTCCSVWFWYRCKRCRCSEEVGFSSFGMLVFCYFLWIFGFLAAKSDEMVSFTWGVCFVPFWLIFCGIFIGLFVGSIAMLTSSSHSERKLFLLFSLFFVPGFFGVVAWFILLTLNLDADDRDLPMIPWILVDTPIIIAEVAYTLGVSMLFEKVRN